MSQSVLHFVTAEINLEGYSFNYPNKLRQHNYELLTVQCAPEDIDLQIKDKTHTTSPFWNVSQKIYRYIIDTLINHRHLIFIIIYYQSKRILHWSYPISKLCITLLFFFVLGSHLTLNLRQRLQPRTATATAWLLACCAIIYVCTKYIILRIL